MSDLIIKLDRRTNRWSVYRTGEFARYVTSFPTLHEAETYVLEHATCAGRAAVAHEPTPVVGDRCAVCGEEGW